MSLESFDAEILQDFLTESGELLEALEGDLVSLEATPDDPALLNQVFRALHTIKGSASFLAFGALVAIAHASESALNAARNGEVRIGSRAMDLLLRAVDVIKLQLQEVRAGADLTPASPELVASLAALADSGSQEAERPNIEPTPDDGSTVGPLELDEAKEDLLVHLVADLECSLAQVRQVASGIRGAEDRAAAAKELTELAEGLARTVEFFEFDAMYALACAYAGAARMIDDVEPANVDALLARLDAALVLMSLQSDSLRRRQIRTWPTDTLIERIGALSINQADAAWPTPQDAEDALIVDGVYPPRAIQESPRPEPCAPAGDAPTGEVEQPISKPKSVEQTIRVEVGRLEALMNLVGELVLQKNRVGALSRQVGVELDDVDLTEAVAAAAGSLDRVTSDIQEAVMRTRMQPLDKIFAKYPRVIRDLAGKTGKKLRLVVEGGDTEVDKSVIEALADPIVHLLRNSADHGIEPAEERLAAGKEATGTIRLIASHEGSHVLVRISDDGRGLDRERVGASGVRRALATPAELASMSDRDVFRFIFAPGFSTASQVSDLSGRGVGMDVVRTNIERLNGEIDLDSTPGEGAEVSIRIPLTVAIMPAMMVAVADETYAIPLHSVVEVVRPTEDMLSTIRERPVMRLRGAVLPLIDSMASFGVPEHRRTQTPFAVVVHKNDKRVGLMVSGVIGQQEIVVKRLDGRQDGPVSGATVCEDGGVCLIVDVAGVIRLAEVREHVAAA